MDDQRAVILYRLSRNSAAREATFEKMLAADPTLTRDVYLRACDYRPLNPPPTGAPAGTPGTLSDLQLRIADAGQEVVQSHVSSSSGVKKAVLGLALAAAAYVGISSMSDIRGIEPHTDRQQWDYQVKNQRWRDSNHGQNAPYMREQDEIDQDVSDAREDGKDAMEGVGGLVAILLGVAGLAALWKMK
jgi:hypothetical protein